MVWRWVTSLQMKCELLERHAHAGMPHYLGGSVHIRLCPRSSLIRLLQANFSYGSPTLCSGLDSMHSALHLEPKDNSIDAK